MGWFKRKPIWKGTFTPGEVEAYNSHGVGMVIYRLTLLGPDSVSEEVRQLIRDLILAHAVETATAEAGRA